MLRRWRRTLFWSLVTALNARLLGWEPVSLLVSLPYLLRRDLGPYAEDRTPFQFLARQMICVALPSHLSCVPYARGVHPLIFFIYTQHPPGQIRTPNGTRLCTYTCGGPGLNPAYICWHVSGHVSTPGCVSRLGPERSIASLTFSFCRSTCTTPSTGLIE